MSTKQETVTSNSTLAKQPQEALPDTELTEEDKKALQKVWSHIQKDVPTAGVKLFLR